VEGAALLPIVQEEFSLCIFDYTGYGYSEGKYSTLGLKEQDDLASVIAHIKKEYKVPSVMVWGRSMGAVTAILLATRPSGCPQIDGMVLDSPFSSTKEMVMQIL
jgi:alpha-beta hydrolase superfamily lysophospholipase